MNAVMEKIDAVEREVLAEMPPAEDVVIPRCLAEAISGVLEEAWKDRARGGGFGGRAKACAIFLDQCIEAQSGVTA